MLLHKAKRFCFLKNKVLSFEKNQTVKAQPNILAKPNVGFVTTHYWISIVIMNSSLKCILTRCKASKTIQSGYLIFLQLVAIVD